MSVADILKKIGKSTKSSELVKEVMREMKVSDRKAYREIKKAWKSRELKRFTLPDRTVLYSLPEWPTSPFNSKPDTTIKGRAERSLKNGEDLHKIENGSGFFDWLKYRSERKRRKELDLRARIEARLELLESSPEGYTQKEFTENLHKHRKKYGLEQ